MRLGGGLLLLAFVAQAGEGLMPLLCPPGMDSPSPVAWVGHGDAAEGAHDAPAAPSHETHDGDETCPFGSGSSAVCGATATAPAVAMSARDLALPAGRLVLGEPAAAWGTLLPSGTFRPPRA